MHIHSYTYIYISNKAYSFAYIRVYFSVVVCQWFCLSVVYLSIYFFVCFFVCLSVCLFTYVMTTCSKEISCICE